MSQPKDARGHAQSPRGESPKPLVEWEIPVRDGTTLHLPALAGEATVFVGPNGSGKSALAHWLTTNAENAHVKRVIAHRRVWLQSAGGDITFAQRDRVVENMVTWDRMSDSRWLDHADSQRGSVALLDLTALENERNARVARLLESGEKPDEILGSVIASPLGQLNEILTTAGLAVQLEVGRQVALKARRTDSGVEYPANQMSDGEKSALLLGAEVLTAQADSVIVIDEPERHLHRAISAALIGAVLSSRPDCHFVLMTHDVDLATVMQRRGSTVLSLSDSAWKDLNVEAWAIHKLDDTIPEEARRAVVGGRNQVLFVEGDEGSLDVALYRLLFPEWSVAAAGPCENVIRSVVGLHQSSSFHWLVARGVVDRDGRTTNEIESLREKGILVLPVCEIESLYYSPAVIDAIAQRQAHLLETQAEILRNEAVGSALAALSKPGVAERLAGSASVQALRRRLLDAVPEGDPAAAGAEVVVRIENPYDEILAAIQSALAASDFGAVARVAPIRDSAALARIRETLRLSRKADYEAAARSVIATSPGLRERLSASIGKP